ncbi:alpha/beta fold hydrolase [soil metagenome]
MTNIKKGFAEVNGTELYFESAGQGMPVVFVHGWLLDTRMWDDQFEEFSQHFQVIRYDCRGYGRSALPTEGYSHSDDLKALLDHLELTRVCIVGHSKGGGITLEFALSYPHMVQALVLENTSLGGYHEDELTRSLVPIIERAQAAGGLEANQLLVNHVIFAPARDHAEVIAKIVQVLTITENPGWQWVNLDPERELEPPAYKRLSEIQVPVLVAFGERDMHDFHAQTAILEAGLPNVRVLRIPDAGHMCNMESPTAFNRGVISFLEQQVP